MPATVNSLKRRAHEQLDYSLFRYEKARLDQLHQALLRWIASMTAVEIYGIWERYAEERLKIALVNYPAQFLADNNITGMRTIPVGLANVLLRERMKYFDFRSMDDLISKSDRLVGRNHNPFRSLTPTVRNYLDTLSDIRNFIVHQSDHSLRNYRRRLVGLYGLRSFSYPTVFLNSIDRRPGSPTRNQPRITGLIKTVGDAIRRS